VEDVVESAVKLGAQEHRERVNYMQVLLLAVTMTSSLV